MAFLCDDEGICEKCGFKVTLSNAWRDEERCSNSSRLVREVLFPIHIRSGMIKYSDQSQVISASEIYQYSVSPRKADATPRSDYDRDEIGKKRTLIDQTQAAT